jgi:hypothetical protein
VWLAPFDQNSRNDVQVEAESLNQPDKVLIIASKISDLSSLKAASIFLALKPYDVNKLTN